MGSQRVRKKENDFVEKYSTNPSKKTKRAKDLHFNPRKGIFNLFARVYLKH
jgi:hypothetical protein